LACISLRINAELERYRRLLLLLRGCVRLLLRQPWRRLLLPSPLHWQALLLLL
jgi:hypothetical protein